jgi:uncharacterized protein (TIGR01777 family)
MSTVKNKKLIITGATGLIGRHLYIKLQNDYNILILTRNIKSAEKILGSNLQAIYWDGKPASNISAYIEGAYGIINLAGENIGNGRWTKRKKERILKSRVETTSALSNAIKKTGKKPGVFIQASATSYYGFDTEITYDETASVNADGFLAEVARKWEMAAVDISSYTRFVIVRFGLVLGRDADIIKKMIMPFRFFLGGYPGNGKQWISWIHIDDLANAISYLLENKKSAGIYNLTAPNPVQYFSLAKNIGNLTGRPSWLPLPAIALRLLYGEKAKELLLTGIRAYPKRLTDEHFGFKYVNINQALKNIL